MRKAHGAQDIPGIEAARNTLNTVFQAASQEMYAAAQKEQQAAGTDAGAQEAPGSNGKDQEVTDVDFEEVKDGDKR